MTREEAIAFGKSIIELQYLNDETYDFFKMAVKALEQSECEDAVPWEQLERYAEWFCAQVSYPEFVREAKAFCESTIAAMKGGNIAPSVTPKQPGWIPVTEKCPEIGQIVLCSLKARHYYGRIHVCKYRSADKYYDHPYFDWSHNGFPDVVAWMPLPTPWEGENNG